MLSMRVVEQKYWTSVISDGTEYCLITVRYAAGVGDFGRCRLPACETRAAMKWGLEIDAATVSVNRRGCGKWKLSTPLRLQLRAGVPRRLK